MRIVPTLVVLVFAGLAHAQSPRVPTGETLLHGGDLWHAERWGTAVACSADGTRVVVGSGSVGARIFVHEANAWRLEHEIHPADVRDAMGSAVAMSADGSVVAVGAPRAGRIGLVRVLVREADGWRLDADVRSSASHVGDRFGHAVALSADGRRLFVGAPHASPERVASAGNLVVFARRAIGWVSLSVIQRSMLAAGDMFGGSIASSSDGSIVLVGARGADREGVRDTGAAAVLGIDGEGRVRARALLVVPVTDGETFGSSVALSSDARVAVVGAPRAGRGARGGGAAYVFERGDGGWTLAMRLLGTSRGSLLGSAVAVSGDGTRVFAGEPGAFRVRVLGRDETGLSELAPIQRGGPRSAFGAAIAVSFEGRALAIGAPGERVLERDSGIAHAVALDAAGDRPAHVVDDTAVPLDATARADLALPHRTAEDDRIVTSAGAVTMGLGVAAVVGGVVLTLAGALSNRSCSYGWFSVFPSCTYRTDEGLLDAGLAVIGVGIVALIVGGAVFSQRQQGPLRPRFALVPTRNGAFASVSLTF